VDFAAVGLDDTDFEQIGNLAAPDVAALSVAGGVVARESIVMTENSSFLIDPKSQFLSEAVIE
jgi:hypothetical protein